MDPNHVYKVGIKTDTSLPKIFPCFVSCVINKCSKVGWQMKCPLPGTTAHIFMYLAGQLNLTYEWVFFNDSKFMMHDLRAGKLDLTATPKNIISLRYKEGIDFSNIVDTESRAYLIKSPTITNSRYALAWTRPFDQPTWISIGVWMIVSVSIMTLYNYRKGESYALAKSVYTNAFHTYRAYLNQFNLPTSHKTWGISWTIVFLTVLLSTYIICLCYQQELLNSMVNRVIIKTHIYTEDVVHLMERHDYRILTSYDNDSSFFERIRYSNTPRYAPHRGFDKLRRAIIKWPPTFVDSFGLAVERLIHSNNNFIVPGTVPKARYASLTHPGKLTVLYAEDETTQFECIIFPVNSSIIATFNRIISQSTTMFERIFAKYMSAETSYESSTNRHDISVTEMYGANSLLIVGLSLALISFALELITFIFMIPSL